MAGNNAAIETEQDLIKFKSVPFFWTMQYGKSLRFVGSTKDNFDDIYIRGTPESFVFEAFFHKNGRIVAVATMGMDPVAAHASLLFASKRMPDLDYLKSDGSLLSIKP